MKGNILTELQGLRLFLISLIFRSSVLLMLALHNEFHHETPSTRRLNLLNSEAHEDAFFMLQLYRMLCEVDWTLNPFSRRKLNLLEVKPFPFT